MVLGDALSSGAGAAIAGTVVGFVLSASYNEFQRRSDRRRSSRVLRRMLYVEINRNVELADGLLRRLVSKHGAVPTDSMAWVLTVVNLPRPTWSQLVWSSNTDKAANALSATEASHAFRHYGQIAVLDAYYDTLMRLRAQQLAAATGSKTGVPSPARPFRPFNTASQLIMGPFMQALEQLAADRNPIQPAGPG